MVNLQADASLSVAAAGLTSGLPYVLPWFLDTNSQNLNTADLNVIGTALRAEVQLDITVATLTAEAIRNAMVDSTLALTATIPATDVGRTAQVDATLAVTASSFESTPVAYDATGTGADSGASTTTSLSWSHTATAGADVFAFVLRGGNNVTVTHDGVAMSYVTAISLNNDPGNGTLYIFRRAAVPGGTKTVAVTFSGATYCSANSVSYLNVGVVKLASTYATAALTASHTIAGADKSIIVSALGQHCGGVDTFVSASGGTLRDQQMGSAKYFNLVIQDSTSTGSVTFSSTVTATNTVSGGVGMILSPPPPTSTHVKTVELLSTVSTGAQPNAYSSINWNHTIESDATLLVVAWGGLSTQFYTSVTVNGQAMTKVGDWAWVVNGYVGWINYHVYLMPPSGVQNIVISGGGTGAYMSATSLTFRNAKAVGAMIYGTNGVVSGQGPNDFLLNVVSGWVDGQAGFTGYNQNLIFADLSTTGEPALFGYARGSAATFNISNLLANYGGWGNAILPIKPMIDAQGDSTLAASATISSAGVLARQSDVTMAITAAIPANSVRTAQIDATQAITASRSGAIIVDLHGNATMPTTAAPTGGALRNANVDAPLAITASRPSNVTWTTMFDVAQAVTATPTSIGSYGATAAVAQTITASRPANITWQLKANVAQPITATITADSLRNANVNATLAITASRDTNVTWVLAANVAQTITATIQAAEQRMVNVDAAQTIAASAISPDTPAWDSTGAGYTSGYGSGSWSHTLVNASMIVVGIMCNATSGATANIDGTINIPQIGSAAPVGGSGQYLFIFALAQPPQGAHTINVANASGYLVGSSVAYRNVWGVSPLLQTNSGSGTSETQTVNATSNVWVFQMFGAFGNQAQSAYNQTARYYGWGSATYPMMFGDAPGATTVSFSATMNSASWGAAAMLLLPGTNVYAGRTAQSAQAITATITSAALRNANVDVTQQIIANRTGAIVVDNHGNATMPVTVSFPTTGVRNANVDSTQVVTASRTANSIWWAQADAPQTITAKGPVTFDNPAWLATGPGTAGNAGTLSFTDIIPVGTSYTLVWSQMLCAAASPTVSVTIGGVSATLVDSLQIALTGGNNLFLFCFGLANPPTGSQTVSYTTSSNLACGWDTVHYSKVASVGPAIHLGYQSGQTSITLPVTDSRFMYAQAFTYGATGAGQAFTAYSQTQRYVVGAVANVNGPLVIGDAAGTDSSLTFSATRPDTTNPWGGMIVPLNPYAAIASRTAVVDAPLAITASTPLVGSRGQTITVAQAITATLATSSFNIGIRANSTQTVTASPTTEFSHGIAANSTLALTATDTAIIAFNVFAYGAQTVVNFVPTAAFPTAQAMSAQVITVLPTAISADWTGEDNTNRTNYSVPTGIMGALVTLIGGGQAGYNYAGPGGGGGGRVDRTWIPVEQLDTVFSMTRGMGGTGGNGGAGGDSIFTSGGITLTAKGGAGAVGGSATAVGITAAGLHSGSGSNTNELTGNAGAGGGSGGSWSGDWPHITPFPGPAGGSSMTVAGGASGGGTPANAPAGSGGAGGGGAWGGYPWPSGPGGNGGLYGGGGGGGGAAPNGPSAGGNGGDGWTQVIWIWRQGATGNATQSITANSPSFVDTFDRADNASNLGSSWTNISPNGMRIVSNAAQTLNGGVCRAFYNIPMPADDVEIEVTWNAGWDLYLMIGCAINGPGVLMDAPNNGSNHYFSILTGSGVWGTHTWVGRTNSGAVTHTDGDRITFRRQGNVYTVSQNGLVVTTWTDADNIYPRDPDHRYVAIGGSGDTPRIYDWKVTSPLTGLTTPTAKVNWFTKGDSTQIVTATPAAIGSRGQTVNSTQPITASPEAVGSRGQFVDSTQPITTTLDAIGSRGQFVDSTQIITVTPSGSLVWGAYAAVDLSLTAALTGNVIWALKATAAQQITATQTALASYGATGNAPLVVTASRTADSTWDTTGGAALVITAGLPVIGSHGQTFDSAQVITALPTGVGSRGQFVDSTLGLTTTQTGAISYGATGNAPLVITVTPTTIDTLLDNHAYAGLIVNALPEANVIWDTRADSRIAITAHRWVTMGQVVNVDAALTVLARAAVGFRATLLFNAHLDITAGLPTRFSRGQVSDAAQAITATPVGGIVWHGRIGAPLQITASPVADSIWDAHAQAQLTITDSGLAVVSHGQDMDPALEVTADTTGDFTQTMGADVEQAILALPDTELSLGSTMDSALSLIVTYSADIGEALRGGNFFYFYL